jgi:hypothetical protein
LTPRQRAAGFRIALEPTKTVASRLFQGIPERQCSRAEYDDKPLSTEELKMLEQAGSGDGVQVLLFTEQAQPSPSPLPLEEIAAR